MITSKQRAYLRGLANTINALHQIGKDGISDATLKMLSDALDANALIKVSVLETAPYNVREAAREAANALSAECVQTIGRRFVLYRESENSPHLL